MKIVATFVFIFFTLEGISQIALDTTKTSTYYKIFRAPYERYLGKKYPEFSVKLSDSKIFSNKDISNKVVYINFWGKYCPPCIAEIEGLKLLYSKLKGHSDFLFVSFSNDPDYIINQLVKEYNLNFKVYHLEKEEYGRLNFNNGIPSSIILDKNGIIRFFTCGGPTDKNLATENVMTVFYPKILQLLGN